MIHYLVSRIGMLTAMSMMISRGGTKSRRTMSGRCTAMAIRDKRLRQFHFADRILSAERDKLGIE
jgi:hypothetical protein